MTVVYHSYAAAEEIPVLPCVRKRKLFKYYNREAMAAVLAAAEILDGAQLPATTPFYYASAETETIPCFEEIFRKYPVRDRFDVAGYLAAAAPQSQFKMMRNMVPCFVSIENGLTGDNNVIIDSASALLYAAITAPGDGPVLLGAGYLHADSSVEAGFALARPDEFLGHPLLGTDAPAIAIFRP
jgi:hypothetical protein